MPSINSFFTIQRQHSHGSHCTNIKRRKWESDMKEFRWLNGRSMPYPDHLKENMPMICPNSWVVDQVREKYGASSHYPREEEDPLNIGIGCNNSIIIYLCT
jgi:hypothetical protein